MGPRDVKGVRYPWWMGPASVLGAGLLEVLGRTWRVDASETEAYERVLAGGQRCIFAFWHARLLALVFTHRRREAVVLVSRHRDGELITRIVGRLGFDAARGSSTRGGEEGLREMLEFARAGRLLGISPDGPRGPAERVKPGLVYLASRTGLPVVPVAAASRSYWSMRSWDRFRVPKPFTRVVVGYGSPITVPPDLDREGVASWTARLEEAIAETTRRTDERAGASG